MIKGFRDRSEAGKLLAHNLTHYTGRHDLLVLALPRGGVPVAYEVAQALNAPLDVIIVRKLGVPGHRELAMGAIASGNIIVLNSDIVQFLHISEDLINAVAAQERRELARRELAYRGDRPAPLVRNKTVILVDDGIATGATMRAAIKALNSQSPTRLIVAVPTAPPSTVMSVQREVDEVVCLMTPEPFEAIGLWYLDFSQTSDDTVRELLARSAREYSALTGNQSAQTA